MRHLGLVASAIAAGTGVLYIGLLVKQGPPFSWPTVAIVVGAIGVLTAATAFGSLGRDPRRRVLALWAAVPGFLGLGYLAGFSIGSPLLVAGALTTVSAIAGLRGTGRLLSVLGWTAAAAVLWGLTFAALLLQHPP